MNPSSSEVKEEDLTTFEAPMFGWSYEKTGNWFRSLGYDEDMVKRFDDYGCDGQALVLWDINGDFVNQFVGVFGVTREQAEEISRLIKELEPEHRANKKPEVITIEDDEKVDEKKDDEKKEDAPEQEKKEEDLTTFEAPMFGWSYEKTACWFRSLGYDEEMVKKFDDYGCDGEALVLWDINGDFVNQFVSVFGVTREQAEEISRLIKELEPDHKANKKPEVITID